MTPPLREPRRPKGASAPEQEPTSAVETPPAPILRTRAREFIGRLRGASQPRLLRCEDGLTYVVKFQNNPQHVRVLANEMLAARLAHQIGLPVPVPAFIEVPPQLILKSPISEMEIGSRRELCSSGVQFGSRFPGNPGETLVVDFLPDRLLRRVRNREEAFLGGFVFDKWTCNCDGRQVIFCRTAGREGSAYSASLIDQGFCFNDGDWTFPDSPIRSLYPQRLVYEGVRGFQSFEPFLSRIENLEAMQLEASLEGIPTEWFGDDPGEVRRLLERLHERRRRLRQAVLDARNSAFQPFPNWK